MNTILATQQRPPLEIIKPVRLTPPPVYLQRVLIDNGKKFVNICVNTIIYLKADRDYTWIHTTDNRSFLSNNGISQIEKKLDPSLFIRIHRSYIVNIAHVKELYRDYTRVVVPLPNNVEVAVGRHYLPVVKQLIL